MKPYIKSTIHATVIMAIVIVLIIIGGWVHRGYIAFDAGFLILLLSPAIIATWYNAEKSDYQYKKCSCREERRAK